MEGKPTFLLVVAAAIHDRRGRFLLQKALPGKAHAGQWEFPGGKVEPGETPRSALIREINEELGIALDPAALEPAGFADEPGPGTDRAIVLIFYTCTRFSGEPTARESQEWGWFDRETAERLPLAALDRVFLDRFAGRFS